MKEIFTKDKKQEDPKGRWYATESTLADLNLLEDQALIEIAKERLKILLEELAK